MPASKTLLLTGLLASVAALSACTSTGPTGAAVETGPTLAMAPSVDPVLPETVAVVPQLNYADGNAADAMRSLAMEQAADVAAVPAAYAGATPSQPKQLATDATVAAVTPVEPVAVPPAKAAAPEPAAAAVTLASFPAAPMAAMPAVAEPKATGMRGEVDRLIAKYAEVYELPEAFVRRVVKRESTFNPNAFNNGHWGLMQIKHATARGMGYVGTAKGLLDPETNLKYAVKYLRGAYMVAAGNEDHADKLYQRGYYYDAKRAGLLDETGLGKDRVRRRRY